MMKRTQTWATLSLTAVMGLQVAWADVPKEQVSTSFSILENITLALLGKNNAVKVHTLVGINGNSHTYQLRALDVQTMQQSQLIVFNGLGFESAAMQRAAASTKVPVIEAGLGLHDLLHGGHEHHPAAQRFRGRPLRHRRSGRRGRRNGVSGAAQGLYPHVQIHRRNRRAVLCDIALERLFLGQADDLQLERAPAAGLYPPAA